MKTKLTKNCFIGTKYYYRDSYIDSLLPEKQEVKKSNILDYKSFENKTFLEIYGNNPDTFSLTEIEDLIESGSDKLLRNGYENLFPVKNKDGSVSVVLARRLDDRRWRVRVDRLDFERRWDVGNRFFSRNFDSLKLGSSDTSLPDILEINGQKYKKI